MVELFDALSKFAPARIVLAGDFMLDTYTFGQIRRISPEAPVPVFNVDQSTHLPGGAGNVALNLRSLLCDVDIFGRLGTDKEAEILLEELEKEGIDTDYILKDAAVHTPVKNRILAQGQQILRIDREHQDAWINPMQQKELLGQFVKMVQDVELVAISDYMKGFLPHDFSIALIDKSLENNCRVIVDPKGTDFTKYRHATLIKPNLMEAYHAARLPITASLDDVAEVLVQQTKAEMILITRSQDGMTLFDKNGVRTDFPAIKREVKDVTGAGDTVLSVLSVALACHISIEEAATLATWAASMAVERVGCARITLVEIIERILEKEPRSKIFRDAKNHVLNHLLSSRPYALFHIDSTTIRTRTLYARMKSFAEKHPDCRIAILVDLKQCDPDLLLFLGMLSEVDVILDEPVYFASNLPEPKLFVKKELEMAWC